MANIPLQKLHPLRQVYPLRQTGDKRNVPFLIAVLLHQPLLYAAFAVHLLVSRTMMRATRAMRYHRMRASEGFLRATTAESRNKLGARKERTLLKRKVGRLRS